MRIGYFVPSLKSKGPINQLINLIGNLPVTVEVLVLVLRDCPDDSMRSKLLASHDHLEVINLNSGLLKQIATLNRSVNQLFSNASIDIIHTQGIHSDLLLALFPPKIPTVVSLRNDPYYDYPSKFGKTKGRLMAILHVWSVKRLKSVVACSNDISNVWRKYLNKAPDVIQNGVDVNRYTKSHEQFDFDQLKGFRKHAKCFITSGSLISRKNVETLICTFNELKQEDFYLLVLGTGPEEERLKEMAKSNICFLGHQTDVEKYYSLADFYISSSFSEGLPNSVLEAMSVGLPVILSDIGPHKELFEGIDYPYFFQPKNSIQLRKVLESLTLNDCIELGQVCRNQVLANFTAKKNSNDYLCLYEEILE